MSNRQVFAGIGLAFNYFCSFIHLSGLPPLRHHPQFRLLKGIWEQRRRLRIHAFGRAALLLGVDGVEVHKP